LTRTLLPEHESKIEELVARGGFGDVDGALREAIQLLEEHVLLRETHALLDIGDKQYEDGEAFDLTDDWFAERRTRAQARFEAGERPQTSARS
jgi:Arc/MetJ-type ribon-helix-helix transcriptional regulator